MYWKNQRFACERTDIGTFKPFKQPREHIIWWWYSRYSKTLYHVLWKQWGKNIMNLTIDEQLELLATCHKIINFIPKSMWYKLWKNVYRVDK